MNDGIVRIGGASAFITDSTGAARQLLAVPDLDYLTFDFLAEVTLSILAKVKARRPEQGYARDFVHVVLPDILGECLERGVRIVANAGGVDPAACRDAILAIARDRGLRPRIALVGGDDLMPREEDLRARGITDMFTGRPFPGRLETANAYLGAGPIARALDAGADLVITGRVTDSSLVLGPLIHEHGWGSEDWDLLAQGSLAGHVAECGAQATGGLFTDWEEVPDWAGIGYPVLECAADGSFVVTKPEGTGGLVTPATVGEQILYEIGDPRAYVLPDVVCDFTRVRLEQVGEDRVRVTGARGRPATDSYKVCATWSDGYRSFALLPVIGIDAARKAQRQADAILERIEGILEREGLGAFTARRVEVLGAEASYGAHSRARGSREVVCKIGVEHPRREALEVFGREVSAPVTSMAAGSAGWFVTGRPAPSSVIRLFSFLLPKSEVSATVDVGGEVLAAPTPPGRSWDPSRVEPPAPGGTAADPTSEARQDLVEVPLVRLAWGRSGDKGDSFNVGIIARRPEYLPWIHRALTEERVGEHFRHVFADPQRRRVERFELPGMGALNFLLHESLGGGGMASLRVDPLAKGMAQQLLELEVPVPASLLEDAGGVRSRERAPA
ncbi:MAG TPA: acyclic terpene utilization AtuA family protein [Thermoanaerobaculia bacterium]|nr:acyclic terpene utilization AtuA family protein [Thermoanaerobaculia bacterium]